ncbi:MAG TPA: tetratricopeptide repeat protein [Xanthomonadales bacterium]|nr:tetratricopeptide repeat protein [Xanthomonadales bacterium]
MFWVAAIAILAVSALIMAGPLLSAGSNWKAIGLSLVLAVPLGGALLYREIGNPVAMNQPEAPVSKSEDFNDLTDNLASNLTETEEDLEGWLLLGRSLKSLQRYDEALDAMQTAQRIAPDNPLVQVELAEAMLFASGNPQISDEVRGMLQAAIVEDPGLQKGLWLLGIDAVQRGDDAGAIEYWQRLLSVIDPNAPIAASVQEQIDLALTRTGQAPQATDVWAGIEVEVEMGPSASEQLGSTTLPGNTVLFVVVRSPGMNGGPPLGVARIEQPQFPARISIDNRNAMLPQTLLSEQPALQIQARLSLEGGPMARAGDWESETFEVSVENPGPHTLTLTSLVE